MKRWLQAAGGVLVAVVVGIVIVGQEEEGQSYFVYSTLDSAFACRDSIDLSRGFLLSDGTRPKATQTSTDIYLFIDKVDSSYGVPVSADTRSVLSRTPESKVWAPQAQEE